MALVAATSMAPGDYFAINTTPAVYEQMIFEGAPLAHVDIARIEAGVGETVVGRTGGAVSLAVGMAQIFSQLPGMNGLLSYWYHFAIMFEALFILTTIDSGTRVGRFILAEFLGRAFTPFKDPNWLPGGFIATALVVIPWAYFIWSGQVNTIWPMFAVANQLLGCVALAVATTIIIKAGKAKYSWVTLTPMAFLAVNTFYGGFLNIRDNYWPLATGANPATHVQGYILSITTGVLIVLALVILGSAVMKWVSVLGNGREPQPAEA
jgi:carbon starvation protein